MLCRINDEEGTVTYSKMPCGSCLNPLLESLDSAENLQIGCPWILVRKDNAVGKEYPSEGCKVGSETLTFIRCLRKPWTASENLGRIHAEHQRIGHLFRPLKNRHFFCFSLWLLPTRSHVFCYIFLTGLNCFGLFFSFKCALWGDCHA